jgi:hypothetical protein
LGHFVPGKLSAIDQPEAPVCPRIGIDAQGVARRAHPHPCRRQQRVRRGIELGDDGPRPAKDRDHLHVRPMVEHLTDRVKVAAEAKVEYRVEALPQAEVGYLISELEKQMKEAAANLEFEKAALLRDQIFELRKQLEDENVPEWERLWKEGHTRRA